MNGETVMKTFIFKCILLVSVLFIGVLIGMQYASEGIIEMKGHEGHSLSSAVQLSQDEEGEYEASVLGNEIQEETIIEKKEKLEKMKAFNFFSSIGKSLAGFVSDLTNSIIEFVASLV
jgi:Protein of unknown function (DUF3679)